VWPMGKWKGGLSDLVWWAGGGTGRRGEGGLVVSGQVSWIR
jgi:hypothetical protein